MQLELAGHTRLVTIATCSPAAYTFVPVSSGGVTTGTPFGEQREELAQRGHYGALHSPAAGRRSAAGLWTRSVGLGHQSATKPLLRRRCPIVPVVGFAPVKSLGLGSRRPRLRPRPSRPGLDNLTTRSVATGKERFA